MSLANQRGSSALAHPVRGACPPPPPPSRLARSAQVRHWVDTGENAIITVNDGDASSDYTDEDASASLASSLLTTDYNLVGLDGDALRPSSQETIHAFCYGHEIWSGLLDAARKLPKGHLQLGSICTMLHDVPALPLKIPKGGNLCGSPVWRLKEGSECTDRHGVQKEFRLSYGTPIRCRILPVPADPAQESRESFAPEGLLLMTLCWSYVLSTQLYELQGKRVSYSIHVLPHQSVVPPQIAGSVNIHVPATASHDLVPWLCALLAPRPGFLVEDHSFAPWSAFCSVDGGSATCVSFTVSTDLAFESLSDSSPPTCSRAMELVTEICDLYGLGQVVQKSDNSSPLSAYIAGFLAALSLPFYRVLGLEPILPAPILCLGCERTPFEPIPQAALRYYMTISMHPSSLGSIIWSIFWQPDIECNVVSPWLASILSVLRCALDSEDPGLVAQVFSLRRPRVALWWMGIFYLDNQQSLAMIVRYLETLEERWGYCSLSAPDSVVAAWTGERQSFLDIQDAKQYLSPHDLIPIAEVLRHRHSFSLLQSSAAAPLSWRPFGHVSKSDVELELWPGLERGSLRAYAHWIWWIEGHCVIVPRFRKATRCLALAGGKPSAPAASLSTVALPQMQSGPSIASTQRMLHYCMEEASGDRDRNLSIIPGAIGHTWLKGWRGFE